MNDKYDLWRNRNYSDNSSQIVIEEEEKKREKIDCINTQKTCIKIQSQFLDIFGAF